MDDEHRETTTISQKRAMARCCREEDACRLGGPEGRRRAGGALEELRGAASAVAAATRGKLRARGEDLVQRGDIAARRPRDEATFFRRRTPVLALLVSRGTVVVDRRFHAGPRDDDRCSVCVGRRLLHRGTHEPPGAVGDDRLDARRVIVPRRGEVGADDVADRDGGDERRRGLAVRLGKRQEPIGGGQVERQAPARHGEGDAGGEGGGGVAALGCEDEERPGLGGVRVLELREPRDQRARRYIRVPPPERVCCDGRPLVRGRRGVEQRRDRVGPPPREVALALEFGHGGVHRGERPLRDGEAPLLLLKRSRVVFVLWTTLGLRQHLEGAPQGGVVVVVVVRGLAALEEVGVVNARERPRRGAVRGLEGPLDGLGIFGRDDTVFFGIMTVAPPVRRAPEVLAGRRAQHGRHRAAPKGESVLVCSARELSRRESEPWNAEEVEERVPVLVARREEQRHALGAQIARPEALGERVDLGIRVEVADALDVADQRTARGEPIRRRRKGLRRHAPRSRFVDEPAVRIMFHERAAVDEPLAQHPPTTTTTTGTVRDDGGVFDDFERKAVEDDDCLRRAERAVEAARQKRRHRLRLDVAPRRPLVVVVLQSTTCRGPEGLLGDVVVGVAPP
mmetsp:Transcript_5972/g.24991  ORF Transcript_5972/g.24991 Transcript_5972/m.24991 type:complete len:624 (+) Transcript_5972:2770-4641(+)